MNSLTSNQLDRRWIWAATVGLILFLLIQVFPVTGQLFTTEIQNVMTRSEAKNKALDLAASKFGIKSEQVQEATVTHLSDSNAVAYLSKYNFMKTADKLWTQATPTDVYAVKLLLKDSQDALLISLNMENGKLVAWKFVGNNELNSVSSRSKANITDESVSSALQYAEFWGIPAAEWTWDESRSDKSSMTFLSREGNIGETQLWLKVVVPEGFSALKSSNPPWIGGSIEYGVDLPKSFTSYLKNQESLASKLSMYGFILPQIILFVLAIIYVGSYGGQTSYLRGIFLSAVYFVLYAGITFNMVPGLRASLWKSGNISVDVNTAIIITSIIMYGAMAVLTYFSAVAGDGLWKSMGHSLWPRWKEAGYGITVLKSMRVGYFLAFILLGAQSLILLILEKTLGSFSSSDASQSMYNMTIPLLLPLLAWCAGISEELQSRLLGIGLFRKWLVGGARKILGREPSRRTAVTLTLIAMIPPGLLWAMGHVGYAIYPVYTRLIELVIMAILFGWFMLRFGIMTVIFAHVTLDAILMGMQMMFDGLPGDFFAGAFSLIMPGLAGIVIWWLHGVIKGKPKPTAV
ncbi:CPBP family intramembrane glutamic endopeptidase [Cohnella abietis]|uniref:Abortive infection protein n=1 Tax=Cohnella abietis TaxID=2507935 RepID=A0A3T1DAH2_9BACL|nr:CPBP family intramembrane glutamic endopeptidase [Cohnella abietis]BBI35073.1 hypothetical protein KCTCHS21_44720 [Cohnella abietis]